MTRRCRSGVRAGGWCARGVRAPDNGANYRVDGTTAQRFPLEWVDQNILASSEYADHHYASSLGETNVASWWYLDEAVRGRINDHYSNLLSRNADFAGLGYWYPKEVESDINVAVLLAATLEYRGKQYER